MPVQHNTAGARGISVISIMFLGFLVLIRGSVEPQAQPITSEQWEGFYLGTHVGAVESSTGILDLDEQVTDAEGATLFTNDLNATGGVHAGYNFQSGNRVFGIEADYSWTDAGRSRSYNGGTYFASSQIHGFGSIRGRAGLAVDNALIFFSGGVGNIDLDLNANNGPNAAVSFDEQITAVVGAGAEAKLGSNLSARLEYLHYFGGNEIDLCQICGPSDPAHGSAALRVLRVGVTYHIGDNPEPADPVGDDLWSGFYIGVHAGAADTSTGFQEETNDIFSGLDGATLFTPEISAAGGFHIGYNKLIRSLLLGIEADYSWTSAGDSRTLDFGSDFASAKIDGFGSVRGRVGVASGNAAAYITGGVGFVDAFVKAGAVPANRVKAEDFFALVAGAGTEVKISSSLSTRLEYLYYGFDEKTDTCIICGGEPALFDGSIHYLRAGLTYHLNDTAAEVDNDEATPWAGFYGGAHAGVAYSNTSIRDENYTLFDGEGKTVFTPSTDPAGGFYAGYNYQWGNAVFGLEGDYTFVNAKKGGFFDGDDQNKNSEIRGYGSVRGRLGLAAGDALFYTTGGIGFVDASLSGGDNLTTQLVKFNDFTALVAGGGVAFKLTDNIAFRTEYLYYGFDEKTQTCENTSCDGEPAFGGGVIHTARAGLSFLLN